MERQRTLSFLPRLTHICQLLNIHHLAIYRFDHRSGKFIGDLGRECYLTGWQIQANHFKLFFVQHFF